MNKSLYIAIFLLLVGLGGIFLITQKSPDLIRRQIKQIVLDPSPNTTPITIEATKLPEFVYDLAEHKFDSLITAVSDQIQSYLQVSIVHANGETKIASEYDILKNKRQLVVHPQENQNFKPGKYRLSLTLRTLEGEVNIIQDFTWGVLAINTNKSIYHPGEIVKLGMAVLTNQGETLCLNGSQKVDNISLTITSPQGNSANVPITDSGQCGSVTVTNQADFQAIYTTSDSGIYQILVSAVVMGEKRELNDYFKVESDMAFDIERSSFPTRIYPPSPYPVTFTITAREDFHGQIFDIVPSDFIIQHISDNGRIKSDENFTRVIWDTNLKAGIAKTFTYFINFPMVSPEFYLLGPIKIGKFQEARQWQIASDAINSTTGVLSYEDNGASQTWGRVWTGTAFNARASMSTTPQDSRWFVEKSSPKTGEKLVALVDNINPDDLYMYRWTGAAWVQDFKIDLAVNIADTQRGFDVTYEEQSGDALFVYSNFSSNQLLYRKRVNGTWDGSSSNAGTGYDVYKKWVRLKAMANSDSILVGYLNNNERVGAMIWDGATNTFPAASQFADDSGTATATSDEMAFDVAWETQSGTPMIFWGSTGNNLLYREFTSGTWQAEATAASGFTNDLDWVFAATDPITSSNNISLGLQDGTSCVAHFGVWTGAGASMFGTTGTCSSVVLNNLIDTAFENSTGKAVWVYNTSAASNQLTYVTWTSGGGFVAPSTIAGTTGAIEGVQLYSDLNTTSMIALLHDANGDLFYRAWDGSAWETLGAALHTDLCAAADDDTEPYGFGFDRNLESLVAYRWFTNANSTDVGAALTGQNTPYTLTTANQAFRLRLLILYPDSLAISGRTYNLQFVDPGTGTCAAPSGGTPSSWTDVPTSGSQISFNNNSTPADGDNLTANGADPTYTGTMRNQDYEESNTFTNSVIAMAGDEVGKWDFSLIDNTTYDRTAQTFCFRVTRSNGLVLSPDIYPQITTAAVADVLILGGTLIQGGTRTNN